MMFFETCGHPIRAGRTQSMRSAIWISVCERGAPRRTPVAGCQTSMTTSAGRRRIWARWRSGSRLRVTAQGAEQNLRSRLAKEAEIVYSQAIHCSMSKLSRMLNILFVLDFIHLALCLESPQRQLGDC